MVDLRGAVGGTIPQPAADIDDEDVEGQAGDEAPSAAVGLAEAVAEGENDA